MALSIFDDRSAPPSAASLAKALGASAKSWRDLIARIARDFSPLDETWGFTSKSTGWGLRLQHRGRTILYMTPRAGSFLVSFALGDKAVQAAHASDLPPHVLETIDAAPKYAEGRGVRFEVHAAKDVAAMVAIARIKMM